MKLFWSTAEREFCELDENDIVVKTLVELGKLIAVNGPESLPVSAVPVPVPVPVPETKVNLSSVKISSVQTFDRFGQVS